MGPVLRQLDVTNLFTLTGLALALGVVIHAAHHRPITAVLCLLGCGLVDLFDGLLEILSNVVDEGRLSMT